MIWQLYWPAWWRLWPSHTKSSLGDGDLNGVYINFLCVGPFQAYWYSGRPTRG